MVNTPTVKVSVQKTEKNLGVNISIHDVAHNTIYIKPSEIDELINHLMSAKMWLLDHGFIDG